MQCRKAGECLSYGLGNELVHKETTDSVKNYNLKAFITYFALLGYLSDVSVKSAVTLLNRGARDLNEVKSVFSQLSSNILRDLKGRYSFDDFNDLKNQLDSIEIPEWVFDTHGRLLDLFPQVFQINNLIYYLLENEGRYYFRCVHISQVEDMFEYSNDFFMDFDTELVPCDEINHTISNKYSRIMAFNKETQTFYLKLRHTNDLYAEYHADTKQEVFIHRKCIGVVNDKFPIVEDKNLLYLVVGNEQRKIKEIDILEEYKVSGDCIYVYPSSSMPVMFRPYILMFDGERMEIPQKMAIQFVLEKMRSDMTDFRDFFFSNAEDELNLKSDKRVTLFSLDYVDCLFLGRYDLGENKQARTYHFLVKLLKSYLPSDKDVLDYFFMLADVSRRMEKSRGTHFIGENVYWRLNELHLKGKLGKVITDVKMLKDCLMEDAYWDEEAIAAEDMRLPFGNYIGYFSIVNGKVKAVTENVDNAICFGDMLIAPWQDMPGKVTKSLETGAIEIQYERMLTSAEVNKVLDIFHVIDVAYRVSVDKR